MDIHKVVVYDPRADGIAYETFRSVAAINSVAAECMHDGLSAKVLSSVVGRKGPTSHNNVTFERVLREYQKKGPYLVVVMGGKVHSEYYTLEDSLKVDLEGLASENNQIVFSYLKDTMID